MYCSVDIWFRRFLSAATEETQRGAADKSDQILSLICLNWYKTELNCCSGGGYHERGVGVVIIWAMPERMHFFFRKPSFMQSSVRASNFHRFNTI